MYSKIIIAVLIIGISPAFAQLSDPADYQNRTSTIGQNQTAPQSNPPEETVTEDPQPEPQASSSQTMEVYEIEKTGWNTFEYKYKFCAGSKDVAEKFIPITTDNGTATIEILDLDKGGCAYGSVSSKALDPSSLSINVVGVDVDVNNSMFQEFQVSQQLAQAEPIPSWVQNIFVLYGDGLISDSELKEAIKFLVNSGVIQL